MLCLIYCGHRMTSVACIFFFILIHYGSGADLPTLYEYYTGDGITSGLSVDQPYFTLNGKNISLYSGSVHYFRIHPQLWQQSLRKTRAAGLNAISTYIPWNLHEPKNGTFEFGEGGSDWQEFADLERYLTLAQEEDLLVMLRPGPYINSEWEWGGLPSWLLREEGIKVRTSDAKYMYYVKRYFDKLLSVINKYQFTKGGPVISVQVENEYGFSNDIDPDHIQQLYDVIRGDGIVELLTTSDGPTGSTAGSLPGLIFMTADFGSNTDTAFASMEQIQPNKPLMCMEFYPGWPDHWTEAHHTEDLETFRQNYEDVLSYPGSVNIYLFHGGTSWGFFSGASIGPGDNSRFQPVTTSYDFDAPVSEAGDYTEKYYLVKELMTKYNTVPVRTPDPPELRERVVYPTLTIDGFLNFNDIIDRAPDRIESATLSMEMLPINDNSGQSYGYIVYRQENIDIPANSILTITAHVRDTVMVLIDGVLISPRLTTKDDLNNFGFWSLENSNLTLTTTDLTGVTLDLVIENWGRASFGNSYWQFKGLIDVNRVYLNDQELTSWVIFPLEFKKSWTNSLSGWKSENDTKYGPGLYKTTLTLDKSDAPYADTFLDTREWSKGIVIINGFVLGQYALLGPQQTLYLPGPIFQPGDNEIVIFEHFEAVSEVKFVKDPIFETP